MQIASMTGTVKCCSVLQYFPLAFHIALTSVEFSRKRNSEWTVPDCVSSLTDEHLHFVTAANEFFTDISHSIWESMHIRCLVNFKKNDYGLYYCPSSASFIGRVTNLLLLPSLAYSHDESFVADFVDASCVCESFAALSNPYGIRDCGFGA